MKFEYVCTIVWKISFTIICLYDRVEDDSLTVICLYDRVED